MRDRGIFIIRPFNNKTVFKLKGGFNKNNVHWLKKAMIKSKSFHNRCLELDMKEVEDIDNQTMSFLTATLKNLNQSGVRTKITGLDKRILKHH
jgi:anti-anti-sigma regulatory factor